MLLDRLLDNLKVEAEPFAVCEVSRGWQLQLDALDYVTFHFVLQGEGQLRTGTHRLQRLCHACLAVVPPGTVHAIESGEPVQGQTSSQPHTRPDGMLEFVAGPSVNGDLVVACGRVKVTYAGGPGIFDGLREPIVLDFSENETMSAMFMRLLDEERVGSPGQRAMLAALMTECLVLVLRRMAESPDLTTSWLAALDDARLSRALNAILDDPARPHTLDSLADEAYMSRSTFVEHWSVSFGRPPMQFVREVRLRRAAELLAGSTLSVDAVASRVGYASRSQFSHAFKEFYGRSPGQFRHQTV